MMLQLITVLVFACACFVEDAGKTDQGFRLEATVKPLASVLARIGPHAKVQSGNLYWSCLTR